MKVSHTGVDLCLIAAMALLPAVPASAMVRECIAAKPTAASYTWNFHREASSIFQEVQDSAQQVRYHAAELQSFTFSPEISWQSQADQLSQVRLEVNELGSKLCRLETVRRVLAPWQQKTVDNLAKTVRVMADNTEDAIQFLHQNENYLWSPTYTRYVNQISSEALSLTNSMGNAVEYASVRSQYLNLRKDMGMKTPS